MKPTSVFLLVLAASAGAASPRPVTAQELERGETVLQRRRPEVEQLGAHVGSFLILPRLEIGETWDSNVFLTPGDAKSDFLLSVRPSLDVKSDWSRHALNFSASADIGSHAQYASEDYQDYRLDANGRVDVTHDTQIDGDLFNRRLHEGRSDPDNPAPGSQGGYATPVTYMVSGGEVGVSHTFNRVRVRLSAQAASFSYDTVNRANGQAAPQNDRDRWEYSGAARVGYLLSEGYQVFVQGSYLATIYRFIPDYGGYDRNSHGYEMVAGTSVDLTGKVSGEFFAGYLARSYADSRLKDFGGLGIGGQLNWSVTQLTTVTGRVSRQVRETQVTDSSGAVASSYNRTVVALGVDHELTRTVLVSGRAQWRQDAFNGISRTDNIYTLGASATYMINRYLYLNGGYTFETRQSSTSGFGYHDHLIAVHVGTQF